VFCFYACAPTRDLPSFPTRRSSDLIEALMAGKVVMAQCHGASLAPYWRVPRTTGVDGMGTSILEGDYATGFPEAATGTTLASLNVEYRGMDADRVTVSSPHSSLGDGGAGN